MVLLVDEISTAGNFLAAAADQNLLSASTILLGPSFITNRCSRMSALAPHAPHAPRHRHLIDAPPSFPPSHLAAICGGF
jgi:hypothetical protein